MLCITRLQFHCYVNSVESLVLCKQLIDYFRHIGPRIVVETNIWMRFSD